MVTIFGKSSLFQVKEVLQTTPERNLELISHSLGYLKPRVEELFYDAEHFFDGFKEDRDYALKTLEAAVAGGAQVLVLCDTNGGTLTSELIEIIKAVQEHLPQGVPWASTPTTTPSWPWPTAWPRWSWAASRCRAPSTASANAAATPISAPSSPPCS